LLARFSRGDANYDVAVAVEAELRRIAARCLQKQGGWPHTIQTTVLVNQIWLQLWRSEKPAWADRSHFRAYATIAVRNLLVDYARARKARGIQVEIGETEAAVGPSAVEVLDIDMALRELAVFAPRQAQLVELRFFGGMSLEDCAEELGIAARTADKDWALARAWLRRRLGGMK
jgi:RNA polymerase sigma factor (TIGR02999 family)